MRGIQGSSGGIENDSPAGRDIVSPESFPGFTSLIRIMITIIIMRAERPDVDEMEIHRRLKSSGLTSEREGLNIAAQDQSLMTTQYKSKLSRME